MQLPHSEAHRYYIEQVKIIEANLKNATSGDLGTALLAQVQKQLDSLAEKYQYNEKIGKARYKLYELQALVHYFYGNDGDALDFINQAIEMRGENYIRAEKLKTQLLSKSKHASKVPDPKSMTKQERRKRLIGLEGWLAFFTVSVALSVIVNMVITVLNIIDFNNLPNTADYYVSNIISPYYGFLIFAGFLMTGVGVWLLILLAKWKKLARWVGVIFLSLAVIIAFTNHIWYADILTKVSGLSENKANNGTFVAILWIIYLSVSKRVKRTLIK